MTPAELDAIRARDRDYDDIFDEQARMPKDIAHRLVAWPVADRRALLKLVDELRERLGEAEALLREARDSARPVYAKGNKYEVGGYVKDYKIAPYVIHRIDAFLAGEKPREGINTDENSDWRERKLP